MANNLRNLQYPAPAPKESLDEVAIGQVILWNGNLSGDVPEWFIRADGQTLSDLESPLHNQVLPNYNGITINKSVTFAENSNLATMDTTVNVYKGAEIVSGNVPSGTTITEIVDGTTVRLSSNANTTGSAASSIGGNKIGEIADIPELAYLVKVKLTNNTKLIKGYNINGENFDTFQLDEIEPEADFFPYYDVSTGTFKKAKYRSPRNFGDDIRVTVGPGGDYSTLNAAIEFLTANYYPVYKASGVKAEIVLLEGFYMQEQVLVNEVDLGWITISSEAAGSATGIQSFEQGSVIPGSANAEISAFTLDYRTDSDTFISEQLRGQYVVLNNPVKDPKVLNDTYFTFNDGTTDYYVWFNTDTTGTDPAPGGTGIEVDLTAGDDNISVTTKTINAIDASAADVTAANYDDGDGAQDDVLSITNTNTGDVTDATLTGDFANVAIVTQGDGSTAEVSIVTFEELPTEYLYFYFDSADWDTSATDPNPSVTFTRDDSTEKTFIVPSTNGTAVDINGTDEEEAAATALQTAIDTLTEFSATVTTNTVTVTNANDGEAADVIASGDLLSGNVTTQGDGTTAEVTEITVADYFVGTETYDATSLNGGYVTLIAGNGDDYAFWFNVDAGATAPGVATTEVEVTLTGAATPAEARTALTTEIDAIGEFSAVEETRTIQGSNVTFVVVTNATVGDVPDATASSPSSAQGQSGDNGVSISARTDEQGVDESYYVQANSLAHSLTGDEEIFIDNHAGIVEEVDYNGTWNVVSIVDSNAFEIDAVWDSGRAGIVGTADFIVPTPVMVSREHLTQVWEFFYYPAFGVARGILPVINAIFEMDSTGDNVYQSYKDGLCATDQGVINVLPGKGFKNAGATNLYGTRASVLNANDGIFDGAGRYGVWAYANTIINIRRASVKDCGFAHTDQDVGNGFDSTGQSVGSGIVATRASIINASGATITGSYGDNVLAEFGAQINLAAHDGGEVYAVSGSVSGKDFNTLKGGIIFGVGENRNEVTTLNFNDYPSIRNRRIDNNTTDFYYDGENGEEINIESGDELFEFSDPGLMTSKGRKPLEASNVIFEEAKIDYNGEPTFDNPNRKWDGRNVIGLFGEYTNLYSPISKWNYSASNFSETTFTVSGFPLYEIEAPTNNDSFYQSAAPSVTSTTYTVRFYAKKGTSSTFSIGLYDSDTTSYIYHYTWDWNDIENPSLAAGAAPFVVETSVLNSEVVFITIISDQYVIGNEIKHICRAGGEDSSGTTIFSDFILTEGSTIYPFIKGESTHPASSLTYSYDWPDQGTIEFWVKPQFSYDTDEHHNIITDRDDTKWSILLRYEYTSDSFQLIIRDSTESIIISEISSTFSDNATLQQWHHFKFIFDKLGSRTFLYIDGTLEISDIVTDLSTVEIRDVLYIGDEQRTNQDPLEGYISDFIIKPYVDETNTHYLSGLPYYNPLKLYGKNSTWSIDDKGSAYFRELATRYGQVGAGIVESGENANGVYTKFSDGTLICTIFGLLVDSTTQIEGNIYRSSNGEAESARWVFPTNFFKEPTVTGSSKSQTTLAVSGRNLANTSFDPSIITNSSRVERPIELMAIGQWK